jgi:hypothetical protein
MRQRAGDTATTECVARTEEHVRCRLTGVVRDFQLVLFEQGLILRGHARNYHAKQLAQHAVMEATSLSIRVNEIEVSYHTNTRSSTFRDGRVDSVHLPDIGGCDNGRE